MCSVLTNQYHRTPHSRSEMKRKGMSTCLSLREAQLPEVAKGASLAALCIYSRQ